MWVEGEQEIYFKKEEEPSHWVTIFTEPVKEPKNM